MDTIVVTPYGVALAKTADTLEQAHWQLWGGAYDEKDPLTPDGWERVGIDGGPIAFVAPKKLDVKEGEEYWIVARFSGDEERVGVKATGRREWGAALKEAKEAESTVEPDPVDPDPDPVDPEPDPVDPDPDPVDPGPGPVRPPENGDGRRDTTVERLFSIPLPTQSIDSTSDQSPLRSRIDRMIQIETGMNRFATASQWRTALEQHTEVYERAGSRQMRWLTRQGYDTTAGERPLGVYAGDYSLLEHFSRVAAEIAETLPPFSDVVDRPGVDAARHVLLTRIHRVPNELAREQISTLKVAGEARGLLDALNEFAITLGYRNENMTLNEELVVGTQDEEDLTRFRVLDFWVRNAVRVMKTLVDEPPALEYGAAKVRLVAHLEGASRAARRLRDIWTRAMDFAGPDQEREVIEIDGRTITVSRYVDWVESDADTMAGEIEAGGRPAILANLGTLRIQAATAGRLRDLTQDDDAAPEFGHPLVLGTIRSLHAQLEQALEVADGVALDRRRRRPIDEDHEDPTHSDDRAQHTPSRRA